MVTELPALPLDDELPELELLELELAAPPDDELELLDELDEELELVGCGSLSPPQAASADAAKPVITSCSLFMRVPNIVIVYSCNARFACRAGE